MEWATARSGWGFLSAFVHLDGASSGTSARATKHQPTRSSELRRNILKIACYLNGEADRSLAAVVQLPAEADTLEEILPFVHKELDLDKRIAYAAEFFLPDGSKISTYVDLVDAARKEHAIIVTCGEPFDPTTVPADLLETYLHGGGRNALKTVLKKAKGQEEEARYDQAEIVRASGHGVAPNSEAVSTARAHTARANRQIVERMRQDYAEQLSYRTEQQKYLSSVVKSNTVRERAKQEEAQQRRKQAEQDRVTRLVAEKRQDRSHYLSKRDAISAKLKARRDQIHSQQSKTSGANSLSARSGTPKSQRAAPSHSHRMVTRSMVSA
jgi:hypothetical protein